MHIRPRFLTQTEIHVFLVEYIYFLTLRVHSELFFFPARLYTSGVHRHRIKIAVAIKVTSYFPWFTTARNARSTNAVIYMYVYSFVVLRYVLHRCSLSTFAMCVRTGLWEQLTHTVYKLTMRLHFKRNPRTNFQLL